MSEPLPVPGGDALLEALLDAAQLFSELGIPYALAGGIAVMLYGRARPTEDVDFVLATGHEAILKVHGQAMQAHHFDPACTYKLYHSSRVEIDIWKDQHADGIAARAKELAIGKTTVRVADVHDLIAMKLRSGRFKDDYDIAEILGRQEVNDGSIKDLVKSEEFERFVAIRERARKGTKNES